MCRCRLWNSFEWAGGTWQWCTSRQLTARRELKPRRLRQLCQEARGQLPYLRSQDCRNFHQLSS
ncbi:hypothetical protein B0T26DRAFT_729471 [Lasiosphaeria miniovina]|uniref:Uncharacterized protein n=1 Tax=Lasiosphaeria miniovina TaxID=1954250 RepID=A0AA39ZSQ1_9PEZI|nr:uncharacterized protein B0T26DRAFT_729471 [Lasiosphaeria miniovina]KAK0702976.1 hypothetical protein B0T26DRAFT_729471 [Lasiosphaeria miniovina]